MTDLESLAEETCHKLLSARDLKAICRFRGFRPPGGGKEALAAFVAPRLLGPAGVAEAMASLEEPWLAVLHRIAMAEESADLDDLRPIVEPGGPSYGIDYRALFRRVTGGLLGRGVVLVEDRKGYLFQRRSRFQRLAFRLPDLHRPLLPPYPVPALPLGSAARSRAPAGFCRRALQEAVRRAGGGRPASRERPAGGKRAAGGKRSTGPDGLLGRVAGAISFEEGRLRVAKAAVPDPEAFARRVRKEWTRGGRGSARAVQRGLALQAAGYVLAHLRAGEGVTVKQLRAALARLGLSAAQDTLARFCEDGHEAGLLVRSHDGSGPRYGAAPETEGAQGDGPLVFRPNEKGIEVDLERTGLGPLLELATVSRVEPAGAQLHLRPDIVLLGRSASRLGSLPSLREVRDSSPAFEKAVRHVERRRGKLLLHEGLLVLRIEDLGLRMLLSSRLGKDVRALGGPYLAAPRALATQVEKLARQEGFCPRKVMSP